MIKIYATILITALSYACVHAQKSDLSLYNNLINKTWKLEGDWGNGTKLKQEITFEYALNKNIVVVKTKGFTNKIQTKFGNRNYGIRKYDSITGKVRFWEYDIFGGLTEGKVYLEGKNIVQQYKYGSSVLTDMWEYVNDSTYNLIIGNYVKGSWKKIYLKTKIKSMK